jgi:expansin (peptidoglycan-binding protein)
MGGTGSCGNVFPDTAKIVAVQIDRMNSSLCGKKVEITNTANGKTVIATVEDTCPGCKGPNSLDLSHGAFDAIGVEATGVLPISWKFLD